MVSLLRVLLILTLGAFGSAHAADKHDSAAQTGKGGARVALVIGNGAYKDAPLKNPPNDAEDIAATLKGLGFDVISRKNANQRDMKAAVREFGQKLRGAEAGLFFFAGHGLQVKGINYLVPASADIQSEADAEDQTVSLDYVMRTMEEGGAKFNVAILDACRNNPFSRSFRSVSRGLAQAQAATGTLIAYATAPGSVAADGDGRNGVYTKHLLKSLRDGDGDILRVFQRVRTHVVQETGGKQTPWESISLVGDFYFKPGNGSRVASHNPERQPVRLQSAEEIEQELWNRVRTSKEPSDFEDYLRQYPSGRFAALASTEAKHLRKSQAVPSQALQGGNSAVKEKDDEVLLKALVGQGTPEALRKYLSMYPQSSYLKELREEIAKLEYAQNFKFSEFPFDLAIKTVHGSGKQSVVTFEDPNCSYCKKLAKEFAKMGDITVFTFLYPILGTDSSEKAKNIWCAPQRSTAWRDWMMDNTQPAQIKCNTEGIDRLAQLGRKLDIRGTPTIFFPNGKRIPGFVDVTKLRQAMVE